MKNILTASGNKERHVSKLKFVLSWNFETKDVKSYPYNYETISKIFNDINKLRV